ncbi:HAMP domain-containing histidine kinase [Streptomyces lunaelactis]|uniref:HAMP domain-containing histidine kinase n=2 Tax=Streptomyces lunaelactis TaxID=1535768 RepID=UPI0015846276|nr:HAMP domain-containing histidine kinase [Streptomyces lunaelactis]NUK05395.1 HAMP domain-containing histidine kinase [Streptomyces lunaelactis]NUK27171.1 HAMP domain-containing histidine kinase [Streptomyces lunaelactis]NUK38356.1 HAMP domain-containing histidine kinase [Streptomyces lunaelactis]NUK45342.1 HAMP domain-containing histidine kinase [Streptomyces lunaelactis]NUK54698.1 HAMP domain-containing histidine kinase [Streptomyces lunaelactis]
MRRRLINSTLAVVLVVIAVFGVSLVLVETRTISSSAQESVDSEAVRLVSIVDSRLIGGEPVNPGILSEQSGAKRYALIEIPGRPSIEIGKRPTGSVIRGVAYGERDETVTVEESRSSVTREVGRTLLIIGGVALLAVIAAVLLAVRQANRLASPLTDLAETAERLGSGDPRPRHKRYGVPELDRVADVLDASAERIARMLTAERRLAADASHQLRTPLTALSMRLEEITVTDDPETVKEEASIALAQVERLTDVVERLLTNSRDPRIGSAVVFDLDEIVKQQLEEWRPAYRSAGRAIVCSGRHGMGAVGTPGAVAQVLAALIENSLMHGGGTVAVRTRVTGNQAVVEVTDEGPGVPADLGARIFERTISGRNSTGIGLAVARDLAEADGGRLELLQQHPPVFALFLSRLQRSRKDNHGPTVR